MDSPQSAAENTQELVATLNALLKKLLLTITLESPLDLTPSLLLAVLESILRSRLPIPSSIRESRDFASKVQAMKIFLGVLENDIIAMDVGLSDIDPRKLAAGEWDEVVFVGEILCWLGKKNGFLPIFSHSDFSPRKLRERQSDTKYNGHVRHLTASSSTHSTTNSHHSLFSMTRSMPGGSDTTVMSMVSDAVNEGPVVQDTSQEEEFSHFSHYESQRHRPQCIHEVGELSFLSQDLSSDSKLSEGSTSYCDCDCSFQSEFDKAVTTASPVRYTGWINRVDDDLEIRSFEANMRSKGSSDGKNCQRHSDTRTAPSYYGDISLSASDGPRTPIANVGGDSSRRVLTRHNSPTEYTLALLNERARLLEELAALSSTPSKPS